MNYVSENERGRMADMFNAGDPLGRIGRAMGRSASTVRRQLIIAGALVGRAPNHREGYRPRRGHTVNEYAFDVPSPERDYWVGMLMTDGCVSDGSVILSLGERDREHVEAFRRFLSASHPVRINTSCGGRSSAPMVDFRVKSDRMAAAMAGFGVVPRKTRTARVIGLENSRDFWRGCIDGNGSVCLCRNDWFPDDVFPTISLCGASPELLDQFREYVHRVVPGARLSRRKTDARCGVGTVSLRGRRAVLLIRHLYEGATVALARKARTAAEILQRADADPGWCVHPRRGSPGKRTPEQCQRIGAAKLGIKQTPEQIAARRRGMLNSAKLKEAARRRSARQREARERWVERNTRAMMDANASGLGVVMIAKKLRCHTRIVSEVLRANGITVKSGPRSPIMTPG